MQLQPLIRFRGVQVGDDVENQIRRHLARLRWYYPAIAGCRVLVGLSDRHHRAGRRIDVRLDLSLPGRRHLLVSHVASPRASARHREQEAYRKADDLSRERRFAMVAIREAFEVARRRLQDVARTRRGDVKRHVGSPHGRVTEYDGRVGLIEAADGHEVYFQNSSVLGTGRRRVRVGSDVSFAEERGEKGPQASSVRLL